jgi:hypothetical protein
MIRSFSVAAAAAAVLLSAMPAHSHELFLRPDSYFLKPNSTETLKVVNGTFDQSLAVFARSRMRDVSIVGDGRLSQPPASDWHDANAASYLKFTTGAAGTYVAGVSSKSAVRAQSADDFRAFLKTYGALDGLDAFERGPKLDTVRLRSSKHVKAVVQVGDKASADFARPLGHPVEIVFSNNPYQIKLGEELRFRVLHQGQPVQNHRVYAGHAGFNEDDNAPRRIHTQELRTDSQGMASFKVGKKVPWYLALIHVVPINDGEADYEATWATHSFDVR